MVYVAGDGGENSGDMERKMMKRVDYLLAAEMLEIAADEFNNHGCNDFELPQTQENIDFVERMLASEDYPLDSMIVGGGKIIVNDWEVMRYCSELLKRRAELEDLPR